MGLREWHDCVLVNCMKNAMERMNLKRCTGKQTKILTSIVNKQYANTLNAFNCVASKLFGGFYEALNRTYGKHENNYFNRIARLTRKQRDGE